LESEASIEGDNDTVTKNENTIELDKFDHFDEVGQTRDEAFILQEVKGSSGELHTDDAHFHPSLENSGRYCAQTVSNLCITFGMLCLELISCICHCQPPCQEK